MISEPAPDIEESGNPEAAMATATAIMMAVIKRPNIIFSFMPCDGGNVLYRGVVKQCLNYVLDEPSVFASAFACGRKIGVRQNH
jgi:hypothetical protein